MRQFLAQKQRIVVRGLLRDSGKILVVPSQDTLSQLEYYELPGGTVSFGADPADALQEFFLKQTKIPITVLEPFCTTSHRSRYGDVHTIEIVYRVKAQIGVEGVREHSVMWVQNSERGYFFSRRIGDVIDRERKSDIHDTSLWSRCKRWATALAGKISSQS